MKDVLSFGAVAKHGRSSEDPPLIEPPTTVPLLGTLPLAEGIDSATDGPLTPVEGRQPIAYTVEAAF